MSAVADHESLTVKTPDLPEPVMRRGITESQWRTLFNLFPGAKPDSALMVWDYCRSRQLDPMKKPCHIVPMRVKVNGEWMWRDVVMPGIYEYRITAQRTGLYLGHTEPDYGPEQEYLGVKAPSWCAMTFFRWNDKAREKVPFPVKVWFAEVVATKEKNNVEVVNERWTKAPIQMLTKCTEAAGLREAFPEEFGGEPTAEEMEGRRIEYDDAPAVKAVTPQPAQRKSQQQGTTTSTSSPAETVTVTAETVTETLKPDPIESTVEASEAPADAPAYIGAVASVDEKQVGTLITLNTGFKCATRNADLITAAKAFARTGEIAEFVTRAPKTAGNAPILEEIQPIKAE